MVLRAGLGGLAAGSVAWGAGGCRLRVGSPGSSGSAATPGPTPPPAAQTAGPAELATAAAVATALQLAYGQAGVVRPDLAAALGRLLGDHTAHLRALAALGISVPPAQATGASTGPTDTSTTSSLSTGTSATTSPSDGPAPTPANALSVLAQLERSGVSSALEDIPALDSRTARLLASIAACRSAHVALLARLPATPPATTTATTKAGG
jgi:hypothetical protein